MLDRVSNTGGVQEVAVFIKDLTQYLWCSQFKVFCSNCWGRLFVCQNTAVVLDLGGTYKIHFPPEGEVLIRVNIL